MSVAHRNADVIRDPNRAMLALARTYRLEVSVVRSGHPLDVFGTDRPSDHPRGRAFGVGSVKLRVARVRR